jgi:osmotically inducible protein OsmC
MLLNNPLQEPTVRVANPVGRKSIARNRILEVSPMAALYTAEVTSTGGRDGSVKSSDGKLDLKLAMSKELGGPGGETNPEQLFAAGYAACFQAALKLVAGKQKIPVNGNTVTARVGIGPNDAGGFALEVDLLIVIPGLDQAKAEELVNAAHQVCPYSNATRNNIPVRLHVSVVERSHA